MCRHPRTARRTVLRECADKAPESTTGMTFAIIILFDIMSTAGDGGSARWDTPRTGG